MWPDSRLLDLIGIELPIIQAPMAGANGAAMAIAVSEAGGLGSLPCAMLDAATASNELALIKQSTNNPININFFCHTPRESSPEETARWKETLAAYYAEMGLDASEEYPNILRAPFSSDMCGVVEQYQPKVVSFHFGLPSPKLLKRVKQAGCVVLSSATTVDEARWLEAHGSDAIIAQGYEAGGHRGMFLTNDIAGQPGTLALVPQVVDAVSVPVVAAGGIADGRGVAAAFALGAAGVQIGTAYLFTHEALITDLHRDALRNVKDDQTALTNVFTGKPARGVVNRIMREHGPMSDRVSPFPAAGSVLSPLKQKAESAGCTDFTSLWSGQSASLGRETDSGELTRQLAADAQRRLKLLSSS